MSASYATSDPRIRVANYGHENWRTIVKDDEDMTDWDITGPPYPTKQAALAAVDNVLCDYFGELPTRAVLVRRIEQALAIAREGSSYRAVERMTAVLTGQGDR
jgi:hypothetical protein